MTPPRPAGDGDLAFSGAQQHNHVTRDIKPVGKCPGCDEFWERTYRPQKPATAAPPAAPEPAPWLATPSEPTVEAELAELAVLRAKVARVEALIETWRGRAVESNGWLITTRDQVRRALDG